MGWQRRDRPSAAARVARDPALAELASRLRERLRAAHHLMGASMLSADGTPAIAFQLSHGVYEATLGRGPRVEKFGFKHRVGVGLGLAIVDGTTTIALAWLPPDSPEVAALLSLRKAWLFAFRGQRVEHAAMMEWAEQDLTVVEQMHDAARERGVMPAFAYWRWLPGERVSVRHLLTQRDRAAEASALVWDSAIEDAREELPDLRAQAITIATPSGAFRAPYDRVVEILRGASDPLPELARIVLAEVERDARAARILGGAGDHGDFGYSLRTMLVPLLMECPMATQHGQAMTSIDWGAAEGDATIVRIPLDLDEIERRVGLTEFWTRIPIGYRNHWHRFLRGDDIPAAPEVLEVGLRSAVLVEDVAEANAAADALLDEAAHDRQWTIPRRAIVELHFAPFVRVEIWDFTNLVVFVCRTARWEYLPIYVSLRSGEIIHGLDGLFEAPSDLPWVERLDATLRLLLASIVRDFLVVEDRAAVFARAVEAPRRPEGKGARSEPVVVYLPRVRYPSRPDVHRLERDLASSRRRAHEVAPHLRRAPQASPTQRALAELHRWTIPAGFTFVRPHRRGDHEQEVVYRSRSALQALYEIEDIADQVVPDDWFAFERSLRRLLRGRGLSPERMFQLGEGGEGVAVFAIAESPSPEGMWLVHGIHVDRLGPGYVAGLVDALARAPGGTRGLLATSGIATTSARDQAALAGITLVERILDATAG